MKPHFKAVLFDLDGTLVDAQQHIFQAFNYALALQGFPPITEKQLAHIAGLPLVKCYPQFAPQGDLEKFMQDHRNFQVKNMELVKKFHRASEVIEELQKKGVKVAIVTARYRNTTSLIVKNFGWDKMVVIAGDDPQRPKPDPQPFEMAAERLGVQTKDCLVVGDGCSDMKSGKAAGCKVCRALYGYGALENCPIKSDFGIDKLTDVLKLIFPSKN